MSLLARGLDSLQVWPDVATTDERGNPVRRPSATPVPVRGRMRPAGSRESSTEGQGSDSTYRLTTRSFPGGPWARVRWDERDFDVVGEPIYRDGSRRTRHWTVTLRARSVRPAPQE